MRSFAFCVLSFVLSLSTVFLPITFAEEEAAQYTLRYKYTPSEFVHYAVDSQNKIIVEKNEAKQTSTNTAKTQKHYRVVWVDEEGNGTLEMTIDRVQMSAQFDDEAPASFDSKDPKQKDLKQYEKIRETIGKPSRMVCSPLGKVISKADQANQGFLIPLPENEVKIGDTWKEEYEIEVAVGKTLRKKVPIRRTFTLESVQDKVAVITFKTTVLTRLNDPKLGLQLIQKTPSGTIKLDIEKGIIVSQDVSLDKAQVGIFDGQGAMRAISSRVETLVTPSELAQKKQDSDSQ
ncbi:MAG: DUF6263 family protein [Planctomycetota bacterium]|jgi:hypothetical protein